MHETMIVSFIPRIWDENIEDLHRHSLYWEQVRHILKELGRKGYTVKALYTGVKSQDCFYLIETEDSDGLIADLLSFSEVVSAAYGTINLPQGADYPLQRSGIGVHMPIPEYTRRRRR